jgi:UDP-N-acetyl-D-mannosaminuronate dehydrogenase
VSAQSEPLDTALAGADAVVIATNHSAYERLAPHLPKSALLVDPWNVTGSAQVFAYADELVST